MNFSFPQNKNKHSYKSWLQNLVGQVVEWSHIYVHALAQLPVFILLVHVFPMKKQKDMAPQKSMTKEATTFALACEKK